MKHNNVDFDEEKDKGQMFYIEKCFNFEWLIDFSINNLDYMPNYGWYYVEYND